MILSGFAGRGRNITSSDPKAPTDLNAANASAQGFSRGLGLFDSTMIVAGGMIGSAIFIVSADMSRQLGSSGWLLLSWVIAGVLTITAALSYGELASMMPQAGGQYVYLRESFSPTLGFLYGWTLFLIIQTGTVAAVAIGFARFLGVLWPAVSESRYLIEPVHISSGYAISLSTAQVVAVSSFCCSLEQHARTELREGDPEHFYLLQDCVACWVDRCGDSFWTQRYGDSGELHGDVGA